MGPRNEQHVTVSLIPNLCKLRKQKRCGPRCASRNNILAGMPGQVEEGVLTGKQKGLANMHNRRRLRGLLHSAQRVFWSTRLFIHIYSLNLRQSNARSSHELMSLIAFGSGADTLKANRSHHRGRRGRARLGLPHAQL